MASNNTVLASAAATRGRWRCKEYVGNQQHSVPNVICSRLIMSAARIRRRRPLLVAPTYVEPEPDIPPMDAPHTFPRLPIIKRKKNLLTTSV